MESWKKEIDWKKFYEEVCKTIEKIDIANDIILEAIDKLNKLAKR